MNTNFSNISFEHIEFGIGGTPDIYINPTGITFSKKMLDVMSYPTYVQYLLNTEQNVFAVRICKETDPKAFKFSKGKEAHTYTFAKRNKTFMSIIGETISNFDASKRYKVIGEFDKNTKTMYFEMNNAVIIG